MRSLLWEKEYFDILAFQIRNTTFDFNPFTGKAPCDPKEENVVPVDVSFLCHRYTNSCARAQTPRGLTGREIGGGGAGTEREPMVQRKASSCLCRRQMSTHLITTSGPH